MVYYVLFNRILYNSWHAGGQHRGGEHIVAGEEGRYGVHALHRHSVGAGGDEAYAAHVVERADQRGGVGVGAGGEQEGREALLACRNQWQE